MHKPFNAVFQGHKQTERRNSRNVRRKSFPNKRLHIFRFFQIVRVSFRFNGNAFAHTCMLRGFRQESQLRGGHFFSILVPLCIGPNEAMDHQVGVTTDRRSEMGITGRGQSEMAGIDGRIARLLHGPQGNGLHNLLRLRPFSERQKALKFGRFGIGRTRYGQVKNRQNRLHQLNAITVGNLMDSKNRRITAAFQISRNSFVRNKH